MGGGGRAGDGIAVARASLGVIEGGGLVGGDFAILLCPTTLETLSTAATAELTRVPLTVVVLRVELFGSSGEGEFFVETFPSDEDLG
jgi:hypothetical protein